ncbi:leucine-rich repeat and calponin homology domain-containing protein 4 isoform X2 [Denticeps clupeoides]|uniref:Calponin-homology (CH) domain-containing protein n=1 Tax=Denticeps clupeoides TaxID=299321 RepID=A0AAY3ZX68_9TELE|nr:leucine-rich repeat and calponin homology domain-containing protein 4-like isoform X2 [Denticeps clupeoides]
MAAGDDAQLPATVAASRSVEKALEEAATSGALNLSNRKLKEFPRSAKNYDLSDITHADLSKNRLCELPDELCHFISLETLSLYHNCVRTLSSNLCHLQVLSYLNISRNQLSSLPGSVCELPLLRILIVSNNKLSSLPSSICSLTHLRQLDVSCNELQCLPVELGQLEGLRDLNLRRNRLTVLPEELSELPLVRLDVSCNRISHIPVCYRHLRHLQSITLDNNPLQSPPAQICSKGKFHIFKFLNMEACKKNQEEFHRAMRPTHFNSCLSDQELFPGQYGGLDSGFNSVDSGSKRWSGNESADDFSERSLRLADISRETRTLPEEEKDTLPTKERVNGEVEQVDFIDSSVREEEEKLQPEPQPASPPTTSPAQSKSDSISPSLSPEPADSRRRESSDLGDLFTPSSPGEERKRPGTLFIWQQREREQQQRERARDAVLQKTVAKTGSQSTASGSQTGSSTSVSSTESSPPQNGLRHRCESADQTSSVSSTTPSTQRSFSRDASSSPPKPTSPTGHAQKPNSFLFRTSSRCSVQPLVESGRCESRTTLKSPREDKADVLQLRKTLESRLKTTLPEDLGEALSNGTVLCQLANHVRPRAVSIIHIPSPAVPKLSVAKCRLNVENFIAACRRLGVPEAELCVASDVLCCKPQPVLRLVRALLAVAGPEPGEEITKGFGQEKSITPPLSQKLPNGFIIFYCLAMALLYILYCRLND